MSAGSLHCTLCSALSQRAFGWLVAAPNASPVAGVGTGVAGALRVRGERSTSTCTPWREPTPAPPRHSASLGWLPLRSPSRSPRPTRHARSTARCGTRSTSSRRRRGWWCTSAAARPLRKRSAGPLAPSLLECWSTHAASPSTRRTARPRPHPGPDQELNSRALATTITTPLLTLCHHRVIRHAPPRPPAQRAAALRRTAARHAARLSRHALAHPRRRGVVVE